MKVLITGGLGYLGGEIAELLLRLPEVEKIRVYDKGVFGVEHFAPLLRDKVELSIGDMRDEARLGSVLRDCDTIIHLASLVGAPLVDRKPVEAKDANILGTEALARLVSPSQKVFFASTGSCYGKVEGVCTEETQISPLSSYGRHKAEGEKILQDVGAVNMRFATVYGLSYRTRNDLFINNMVKKALTDRSVVLFEGGARRTFIHVHDAARAVEFLMTHPELGHDVYNIGDNSLNYTKRQICDFIAEHTDFNIIENEFYKDPDQRDYAVDYTRLTALGYKPIKDMKAELATIFEYYHAHQQVSYENG